MKDRSSDRDAEIDRVFFDTLPFIQIALVHYRLSGIEAKHFEEELRTWFQRLVCRVNNDRTPVTAFREYLLLETCRFARGYQAVKLRDAASLDERFQKVLAQNPRQVAFELQRMLEKEAEEVGEVLAPRSA